MPLETGQDYYNYYSSMMPWGNQGTGTTAPGTGITQLATPGIKYPPQGGGGGGFQLPQNYYTAPNLGTPGVPDQIGVAATGLPQTNQGNNFFQNLNFPGKQFVGVAGNLLKKGLGSAFSLIGGALPKMSPEAAANQRWAVDGAGYGQGTQRDQFGNLVGQSLMDPSRTYGDRLADREDELAGIIESQKLRGTWKKTGIQQRELDHINLVNEIKEKERIAEQQKQEALRAQVTRQAAANKAAGTGGWQSGMAKDEGFMSGSGKSEDMGSFSRGGILGAF